MLVEFEWVDGERVEKAAIDPRFVMLIRIDEHGCIVNLRGMKNYVFIGLSYEDVLSKINVAMRSVQSLSRKEI